MSLFAEIAFPTPVRRLFTYSVPDGLSADIAAGKRVWVPLRGRMAIGMVMLVHSDRPHFECKPVTRVLDEQSLLDPDLLWLLRWMHHYYFCSIGEAIQTALPAGFNFVAVSYLRPTPLQGNPKNPTAALILSEIREKGKYVLAEAEKRWEPQKRALKDLVRKGYLEIWEEPELSASTGTELVWTPTEAFEADTVLGILDRYAHKKAPAWVQALRTLLECPFPLSQRDAASAGLGTAVLKRIEKEGLLTHDTVPLSFSMEGEVPLEAAKKLNAEQQEAFATITKALDAKRFETFLLHGVTGSGKTEVYIHAIRHALDQGKTAMVLVPEIALTPQTVRRFAAVFGNRIAVLHSRMSDRERLQAWSGLKSGRLKLVIGARSAVFSPLKNLGIIIIDEEHDGSYKQEDPAPRYHARDVAIIRAHRQNAVVVLGSATPSMAALKATIDGKSRLLELKQRPFLPSLPEVRVIDLKQYRKAMRGPLAVPLFSAIQERLERGEQSLLLYNRRGFASYMQCPSCGDIPQCPSCSVSLTYHKPLAQLRCHYCGYAQPAVAACTQCDANEPPVPKGSGTQQVEDAIAELFPAARVLRLDQDTARGKYGHERILGAFARGEADILVGTQLVAKGLDFPNLTLAGVVNADTELAFPSFRSGERMFQLLTQVAGRPGRAEKPGIVFLQTMLPDHPALQWAQRHDYRGFAAQELPMREALSYPPYSRLINILFRGVDADAVRVAAFSFSNIAQSAFPGIRLLGPAQAVIYRMHGQYRWEAQIKAEQQGFKETERMLDTIVGAYEREKPKAANAVRYAINVDAVG